MFVVSIIAGAIAAVAGFGIGSLLTPVLAASTGTKTAVALVALPHIVATALRLWMLGAAIDRQVLKTFGVASAVGGLAGALLHATFSSPVLSIVLGALLIFSGASEFIGLARRLRFRGPSALVAGVASGAFGGLVGNQGGIRTAALLRFDLGPRALIATATASALLVDLARTPVYMATSGAAIADHLGVVSLMSAGVVLGTLAGAPILRRLPAPLFRRVLAGLLIGLGAVLISGAFRSLAWAIFPLVPGTGPGLDLDPGGRIGAPLGGKIPRNRRERSGVLVR